MLKLMLACCKVYISESRNKAALESIEQAAKLFSEAAIVNKFEDVTYNRVGYTVVSKLAPKPSSNSHPLKSTVFAMVKAAFENIDLDMHSGSHPRLGVVDHICFHPLASAPLDQVAEIAKSLAGDIGSDLQVPTFLYGAAHEEERTLDSIRRNLGYFKPNSAGNQWAGGLNSESLLVKPDRGPDQVTQSKGVIVIGSTRWVDNYNVPVFSTNIAAVRRIAKRVSEKNVKEVGIPKQELEKVAAFGHGEDDIFEKARHAQREAEQASKVASANAEKSFRLLKISETSRKEVQDVRKKTESLTQKIEDTKIADVEAKAKKDALADATAELKKKAADFDEARSEARALAKQLKAKSEDLKGREGELGDLKTNLDDINSGVDNLRKQLKDLEAKKPKLDELVTTATTTVKTSGQDVDKLVAELNDAEKHAADLERQAREAREKANAKKAELDNAKQKKTTVTTDLESKKNDVADLDNKISKIKAELADKEGTSKDITGKKTAKKSDVDKLIAELQKLEKEAKIKDDEARAKRKAYEDVENRKDQLEKEAADAAAAQTEAHKTRQTLEKELHEYSSHLEKLETRLVESTEEAKQALDLAKSSDARKHSLLEKAQKFQKEADDLTHKKIATAEDVLASKLGDLTEESKVVLNQKESHSESHSSSKTSKTIDSTHVNQEGPATPDLTKQATKKAQDAKEEVSGTNKSDNGSSDVKKEVKKQASNAKGAAEETAESVKKSAQETSEKVSKKVSN